MIRTWQLEVAALALVLVAGCGQRPEQRSSGGVASEPAASAPATAAGARPPTTTTTRTPFATDTARPPTTTDTTAPAAQQTIPLATDASIPATSVRPSIPIATDAPHPGASDAPEPVPTVSGDVTTYPLDGFVFSYPTSLHLTPVPGHLRTVNVPDFPSMSADFGDGGGRLVTMTIAEGGQQLIDSNAQVGDPLTPVQIGDRTFYAPDLGGGGIGGYGLMLVVGDHVAAFGFSLFTPADARALVAMITVAPADE
ncbi:MAG: hypothetical protein JWN39_2316 [Ilumatobacteraceae bacterium]|nr:hypothetical protein [Ilumatobacteraceae bacterium]